MVKIRLLAIGIALLPFLVWDAIHKDLKGMAIDVVLTLSLLLWMLIFRRAVPVHEH